MKGDILKDFLTGAAVLGVWVVPAAFIGGFVGAFIGMFRQRRGMGLVLGATMGPAGWLSTVFLDPVPEGKRGSGGCLGFLIIVAWLSGFSFAARVTGHFVREKVAHTNPAIFNPQTALKALEAYKNRKQLELLLPRQPSAPATAEPKTNEERPEATTDATPAPAVAPRRWVPVTPKPTPTPAEVQAEILRKYGTPAQ